MSLNGNEEREGAMDGILEPLIAVFDDAQAYGAMQRQDESTSENGREGAREPLLNGEGIPPRLDPIGTGERLTAWQEFKELGLLSIPVALSTLCRLLIINTSLAFVGHLGKKALSAASFATTYNQFLSNVLWSPGFALATICSQAIGAGNPKLAGVWLQLAMFVSTILCIPVLLLYLTTAPVVQLMMPVEGAGELAYRFNLVSMLVLWPMVIFGCIRQYFQSLEVVAPAAVVSFLTVFFNYAMNALFVPKDSLFGWGLEGSPFAAFLSMIFQISCFVCYVVVYKKYHRDYWGGWTWAFLKKHRIKHFQALVVPMAIGTVLENSGFQLITFTTGRIGTSDTREALVAGNAIVGNLWELFWSFYWGAGLALQIRVGGYLGEGNVHGAKLVARISILLVFAITTSVGAIAFAFRTDIARLYTDDPDVIEVVEKSLYAVLLDYLTTCTGLCAVNILQSMAQTRILAITLSVTMWFIQVPFALLFAYTVFKEEPVAGIWLGQVVGEAVKSIILWVYITRIDWMKLCVEAKQRSEVILLSPRIEGADEDSELEDELEFNDPEFRSQQREVERAKRQRPSIDIAALRPIGPRPKKHGGD